MGFHVEDWPSFADGVISLEAEVKCRQTRHLSASSFLCGCTAVASRDSFPSSEPVEGACFGGTIYAPLGLKACLLTAFPACFANIVPRETGGGGGSVQHCLHSKHDNNTKFTIIVQITLCSAILWNQHVPL